MSCSPFDLRDYFLQELAEPQRRQVESHLQGCAGCREELDRFELTGAALRALADEEIPQRIAFVSDKVFEPSPWRRAWGAFWSSGPRLGFASAAMLSVALLASAVSHTPLLGSKAPAAPVVTMAQGPVAQTVSTVPAADVDSRIAVAVEKAVAEAEARQNVRTASAIAEIEKRNELDRRALQVAMEGNLEYMRKRLNRYVVASNDYGPPRADGGVAQ